MCVTRGRCGLLAACDGMMESVTWLLTDYSPAHVTSWPANQRPDVGPIDQSEAGENVDWFSPADWLSWHGQLSQRTQCAGHLLDTYRRILWRRSQSGSLMNVGFWQKNTGIDKLSQIGALSRFIKSRLYLSNEVRGRQIVLHVQMSASSFKIYWWTRLKVMKETWETAKM